MENISENTMVSHPTAGNDGDNVVTENIRALAAAGENGIRGLYIDVQSSNVQKTGVLETTSENTGGFIYK